MISITARSPPLCVVKRSDELTNRFRFKLVTGAIHDQACRRLGDHFNNAKAVFLERLAGLNEVNDAVSKPEYRRQLHRSRQFDQVNGDAALSKVPGRDSWVLGCHSQHS